MKTESAIHIVENAKAKIQQVLTAWSSGDGPNDEHFMTPVLAISAINAHLDEAFAMLHPKAFAESLWLRVELKDIDHFQRVAEIVKEIDTYNMVGPRQKGHNYVFYVRARCKTAEKADRIVVRLNQLYNDMNVVRDCKYGC